MVLELSGERNLSSQGVLFVADTMPQSNNWSLFQKYPKLQWMNYLYARIVNNITRLKENVFTAYKILFANNKNITIIKAYILTG
ncbi:MAG: hypothetical protein BWX58_00571 [Deltaproteobacteria bacterium ADurb.Bin026]|nr:MAG: hypothetical protein BWX58_00571 [Deltaproteobacteria bacterium ADurb.Bin026]